MKYIYCVTNKINGLKYVGQTNNPKRRWYSLCCDNDNQKITKAIQEYGKENFEMEILEKCTIDNVDEKEKYWIDYYNTYEGEGYNEHCGGTTLGKGEEHPRTGQKTPEKVKEKMRKSLKENGTLKLRQGKNHPYYGEKHSKEELGKMSKNIAKAKREKSKFNKKIAIDIIKDYFESDKIQEEIGNKYNTSRSTVSEIINCNHWTTKDLKS